MGYKAQATKFFQEIEISEPLAVYRRRSTVYSLFIWRNLWQ